MPRLPGHAHHPRKSPSSLTITTPCRDDFNQRVTATVPWRYNVYFFSYFDSGRGRLVVNHISSSTPSAAYLLLSPREYLAYFFDARLMGTAVTAKNPTSRTTASESLSHQLSAVWQATVATPASV